MTDKTMQEWTIDVETPEGATSDPDELVAFHEAIERDRRALGPAAGIDTERGVLQVTFQVEAETSREASVLGHDIFELALERAGVRVWERTAPFASGQAEAFLPAVGRIAISTDVPEPEKVTT